MAYCTASDIAIQLGVDTYTATTRPTLTQINSIIDNISGEIDFHLSAIGITSPTDVRVLSKLKNICIDGVACRVGFSNFGNNQGVDNTQPNHYCKNYKESLNEMKEDPSLYGITTGNESVIFSSNVLDGTLDEADANNLMLDDTYRY
jgi:hypothetical protein